MAQPPSQEDLIVANSRMHRGRGFDLAVESLFRHVPFKLSPGEQILELGCGDAHAAAYLADAHQVRAHGIDLVRHPDLSLDVEFRRGDIQALPYDDARFALVFSFYAFPYVPDKLRALAEAHRVLKPEGIGVIDFGRPHDLPPSTSPPLPDLLERYPGGGQLEHKYVRIRNYKPDGAAQGPDAYETLCERVLIRKSSAVLELPRFLRFSREWGDHLYTTSHYAI